MRVLHIHSQAAVAQIIVRSLNQLGHQARVYHHYNSEEKFCFDDIYGDVVDLNYRNMNRHIGRYTIGEIGWYLDVLRKARGYDIIHIHDKDRLVPILKRFYKKKPIVLTYHGTQIRSRWEERKRFWLKADLITVVSSDLLNGAPDGVLYIKNPVDINHFTRLNDYIPNTAFFMYKHDLYRESLNRVREIAEKMDLFLTVIDRRKHVIPYPVMPRHLELFEYVFDIAQAKNSGFIVKGLINMLGYNALAMGCKVIDSESKIITSLPEEMKPKAVAENWINLYKRSKVPV